MNAQIFVLILGVAAAVLFVMLYLIFKTVASSVKGSLLSECLTIVIAIMLGLIGSLFLGVMGWLPSK